MNIFQLHKQFNTQNRCIRHLEKVRWGKKPICPHCSGTAISKRKKRKYFYHCNKCNKDFTVLYGTIFEASKLPLPKWFMLIGMMLNARKGISSMELHRQLGVTYKSAWYSAMRVRCALIDEFELLEGIIEMDEAYIGGKPRKRNMSKNTAYLSEVTVKRGRGTKKVPIVGIVEREGKKRVRTEVAERLTTKSMLELLKKYVNTQKAIAVTDEANFYDRFEKELQHLVIKHKDKVYVKGIIHTNTIDGFWSIIKNGIRGEYHVLSKKYLPFYLAEFTYKYNRRFKQDEAFDETIEKTVSDKKCLIDYKPKGNVECIAYGNKCGKKYTKKSKHKFNRKIVKQYKKRSVKKVKLKVRKKSKIKVINIKNKRKVQPKKRIKVKTSKHTKRKNPQPYNKPTAGQ